MVTLRATIGGQHVEASITDAAFMDLLSVLDAPVNGTLADLERWRIERALALGASPGKTAAALGINRKTLWARRKKYGLT